MASGSGSPAPGGVAGERGPGGQDQAANSLSPSSPCPPQPLPGTLYRYTLLLYGTAEDMTARPLGPQVTSSACVQRDTEGLCQGECLAWHGLLAGRRQRRAVCVCGPGREGRRTP